LPEARRGAKVAPVLSPDRQLIDEIGRGLLRVRKLIHTEAGRRLEKNGSSVLAWQALNYLDRCGPVPQGLLAEGIGQHAPGISRLVDELERQRLVRRGRDRHDRRRVVVALARRGRVRLEEGRPAVDAAVEQLLAPLDLADRRALRNLLVRMVPQK
jgi:DNA-binding MarR family transcriptional regulator